MLKSVCVCVCGGGGVVIIVLLNFLLLKNCINRLYDVGHVVKEYSDNDKGNPLLLLHGYAFRLPIRDLLYASSYRQESTYHGLCYTSCGAFPGARNSSMGPQ